MAAARQERRVHRRYDLACPITILNGSASPLESRSENISDGGLYLTLRAADLADDPLPPKLAIKLMVPRSTPNSFMYEDVSAEVTIVRQSPCDDGRRAGLALRFVRPVVLDLE
jgi:hypothetical protein